MKPEDILFEFETSKVLPKRALRAASAQRPEMVPVLLRQIEGYLSGSETEIVEPSVLFFAFHLMGEWRETSAYRPLLELLCLPSDELHEVLGDAVTEHGHRVIAAVFDGDPQPLYDLVRDDEVDEYARARMCEAIAMLVLDGRISKDEAAGFLTDCFTAREPEAENFVWHGWQSAIAMLGLTDLKEKVQDAFDRGLVSAQWLNFGHFEQDLSRGIEHPGAPHRPGSDEYTLFGDTVAEFSDWYGFTEKYQRDQERGERARQLAELARQMDINPNRRVGRNDPCPCGSGKKYKRCCLQ